MKNSSVKIFVCGDVMTGRGIDQIQQHPSQPQIYEDYVKDARDYVKLVEAFHEALPRRVHPNYIWGGCPKRMEQKTCKCKNNKFRNGHNYK